MDASPRAPVAPPAAIAAARGAVALLAVVGAVALDRHGASEAVRAAPIGAGLVGMAATVSAWRRPGRGRNLAAARATELAALLAGAAVGSTGHPDIAVMVCLPVAWASSADADANRGLAAALTAAAAPLLAAGAALSAAAGTGRFTAASAIETGVALALAGAASGAGALAARRAAAAEDEREELRRLRSQMVTTVSHELRTPLTVIQGVTATLSRRWDVLSEPERLDLIDVLTENVASLDSSILHFVDAARLERGLVVLEPEWLDLAVVFETARSRRAAALAGHEVRAELGVGPVWADRAALERIFEHLLLNAARFSAVGLPISVRTSAGQDEVVIIVSDRGQGIAPHLLATIWEPLQRGDVAETGVSRGAGLGLPIVRELARLHGGDADLQTARGRGTTVRVTLPQPPEPDDPQLAPRGGARRRRISHMQGSPRR